MKQKTVLIIVQGGVVQGVVTAKGVRVIVRDYDVQDDTNIIQDESGDDYIESIYED